MTSMESENVDYIGNHPNWAALASVYIPYKRFIQSSNISDTVTDSSLNTKPINKFTTKLSGEEARKLYETITYESSDTPYSSKAKKYEIDNSKTNLKTEKQENCNKKIDFDKNKFFRAATHNDLTILKNFIYKDDMINSSDHYGWSALMMAACENSFDAVKFLLHEGANRYVKDKQGNTALSLAKTKGYTEIIDLLQHFKIEQQFKKINKESTNKTFKHFCTICDKEFTVCKIKEHETSTVHLFNIKNENKKSFRYAAIPNSNRGLKLMIQQGWDRESGLGPKGTGNLFPIKTVLRKNRTGLGIEQDSAKVTHFKPYDTNAIKYKEPLKTKSRNEMKKEKLRNQKIERRLRKELS